MSDRHQSGGYYTVGMALGMLIMLPIHTISLSIVNLSGILRYKILHIKHFIVLNNKEQTRINEIEKNDRMMVTQKMSGEYCLHVGDAKRGAKLG